MLYNFERGKFGLDPDDRATSPDHQKRCEHPVSRLLECTQCGAVRVGGEPCHVCGYLPQRPARAAPFVDGDLGLVDGSRRANAGEYDREQWHGMLVAIGQERGYKPGWAAHKFKEKFGHWPQRGVIIPVEPTRECRAWVRSRMIAYAKSQARSSA